MLPRPRTLLLLLGVLVIGMGLYGLFTETVRLLNAEANDTRGTRDLPTSQVHEVLRRNIPVLGWFDRHSGSELGQYRQWAGAAGRMTTHPALIAAAGLVALVIGKKRAQSYPVLKGARGLALAFLCVGAVALSVQVMLAAAELAEANWWIFLVAGGGFSLLLILFHSEELSERWLAVVTKSALFVGMSVLFLLGFYCFAVASNSSRTAALAQQQRDADRELVKTAVEQYASAPQGGGMNTFLARTAEALGSDREIALYTARFIHKEAGKLPAATASEDRGAVFKAVFPAPFYSSNRLWWEDAYKRYVDGANGDYLLSFETVLQRTVFGNEALRKAVPYRTYIRLLREERIPLPPKSLRAVRLDCYYEGELVDFKEQLRLRNARELDLLSPHCEVFYASDKDDCRKKAFAIAARIREVSRQKDARVHFIVPEPTYKDAGDKYPQTQVNFFARGGTEYQNWIAMLLGSVRHVTGDQPNASAAADVDALCQMKYSDFYAYQGAGGDKSIRKPSSILDAPAPSASNETSAKSAAEANYERSKRLKLWRELTTVTVLSEYGDPQRHFEIWVFP